MNKKSLIYSILAISVAIFIVDVVAHIYFLYFKFWWLDILMHTSGGIFLGLVSLYLYYFSNFLKPKHYEKGFILLLPLLFSAFVGVLWEFFEFITETIITKKFGVDELLTLTLSDTLSDLFFDISGGIIAAIIFTLIWKKEI